MTQQLIAPKSQESTHTEEKLELCWVNIIFFGAFHVIALLLLAHWHYKGVRFSG